MFFKNAIIYTFTTPAAELLGNLDEQLQEQSFKPCGKQDTHRVGFVPPLGDLSEELTTEVVGNVMVCMQRQEKVLPAASVKKALEEKIAEIEHTEDRRVYGKEKQSLKDDIIFEMLPQAFVKDIKVYAYIDTKRNLLVIDSAATGKAEDLMKLLRQAMGSLPVIPVQTAECPSSVMTNWLVPEDGEMPEGFDIGQECKLIEPGEGGARHAIKNEDLFSPKIEALIYAGRRVEMLAIERDDIAHFKLTDTLQLKGIKFADKLIDEAKDQADGDKAAQFDADFTLMAHHLGGVIDSLIEAFGGNAETAQ